jgi:anti-sigma regulatory factor (Ser/Thr protein kinase)
MNCKDDTITVAVIDEGDGITYHPRKPNIERIMDNLDPPLGIGVFLIDQLADQVEFNEVTDKGHAVKMAINIK